jgi:membrane protein implicated in regulation of membrane protease activity
LRPEELLMDAWMVWIVLAVILAAAELMSLSFFLAPFAAAAVLGALAELAGLSSVGALSVFVVSSGLLLARVRPIVRRHLSAPARIRSGVAALVGQTAVVIAPVDVNGGAVKLEGEIWSARAYLDEDEVIEAGSRVHVVEIRGATALVSESV